MQTVSRQKRGKIPRMKAQHQIKYKKLPPFLRQLREDKGLTQRALGAIINKPQSYVYGCEVGNRRVDISEFIIWAEACGVNPQTAFNRLLKEME